MNKVHLKNEDSAKAKDFLSCYLLCKDSQLTPSGFDFTPCRKDGQSVASRAELGELNQDGTVTVYEGKYKEIHGLWMKKRSNSQS